MKKIICAVLIFCLLYTPALAADSVHVVLNGTEVVFPDAEPCLISDRTMVPMRAVFEALGAGVYWDENDQMIVSMRGMTTVTMQINNPTMFVSGITSAADGADNSAAIGNRTITLDVAPCLVGDRTMVPLRAISESFGLKVEWDDATQTVFITGE